MSSEHGLHVMLSYHWDNKELVSKVYKVLKSRGIPVWMDIHGGISFNLFQRYKCYDFDLTKLIFLGS